MKSPTHRTSRRLAWLLATALALPFGTAAADPRADTFIRLLETSSEFRVRTQAALSLARTDGGRDVVAALVRALSDNHPAVRAAAATALATVGDASAIPALEHLAADRDANVRTAATASARSIRGRGTGGSATPPPTQGTQPPTGVTTAPHPNPNARYYVGVGMPGTRVPRIGQDMLRHAHGVLTAQVGAVSGVEVAPADESQSAAQQVLQRRRLAGAYIDCSIVSADATANGTRVAVSVIVGTYPGRDMRAILQGAATVPGASGPEADRMAIEGAIRGALRNLPQALTQAAGGR